VGINSSSETRASIAKLKINKALASNYMILRDGEEPRGGPGFALLVLGGGMILGGGAWLLGVLEKKRPPAREKIRAMADPRSVRARRRASSRSTRTSRGRSASRTPGTATSLPPGRTKRVA